MDCRRYIDALSSVAAGDPPPLALERHLEECDHCRAELAMLRSALFMAGQELGRLASTEPSVGFARRLRAAVIEDSPAPAPDIRWFWPAAAAASVVTISALLFVARQSPPYAAPVVTPTPPVMTARATSTPTTEADPASARDVVAESPPRPVGFRTRPVAALAEPPVLVPPGESRALMAFVALIGPDEPVTESNETGDPAAPIATLTPISIAPIQIVPLSPPPPYGT